MCETIILDGNRMTERASAHDYLAETLAFPEYYGKNLDALHEVLTESRADVELIHCGAMLNALGKYGCKILMVFMDSAEENPHLHFRIAD